MAPPKLNLYRRWMAGESLSSIGVSVGLSREEVYALIEPLITPSDRKARQELLRGRKALRRQQRDGL